jgi:predicted anti-sigma-YlaC factor YlaD
MSRDLHVRAEELIAQDRVEGLPQKERDWLDAHLRECAQCSEAARQTANALKALRSVAIALPRGLTDRTKFRVQLRAQELQEREPKRMWLWIVCAMSWGLGVASAPYVWQAFEWVGRFTGAPKLVIEFGFGLWWMIPALFAAAIVLFENARQAKEKEWNGE